MNKKIKALISASLLSLSLQTNANDRVDLADIYADVLLYRPIGLAMTIAGSVIFAAISPMLAIAELNPSNQAFADAKNGLVITPYDFTFNRPLGVLRPGPDEYQKR
ncbi:hypothetical protein [Methylomonas rapida]|uniref:Uncharacterized protein n=1 Tax=Methylomonas rapida TaxID=2963939 RepID=A0ABY7GQU0_9GAMM|nr:hypothetical protein [Methylomonas rapida]WAR46877.1 hypothetical protein NM686_010300 [Methylomonas rapida]